VLVARPAAKTSAVTQRAREPFDIMEILPFFLALDAALPRSMLSLFE
jgi:hypothetical protein